MKSKLKKHEKLWIFIAGLLLGALVSGGAVSLITTARQGKAGQAVLLEPGPGLAASAGDSPAQESAVPPFADPGGAMPDPGGALDDPAGAGTDSEITGRGETPGSAYREWTKEGVYLGGDEVFCESGVYRARWWTQGERPDRGKEGVWEYLGELPENESRDASGDETASSPVTGKTDDKKETAKNGASKNEKKSADGTKVVAYYPSWKEGKENLEKLRFDIITHVNYAFAIPTGDGGVMPLENPDLARAVVKKAHDNGAKALLAVGGWSYRDTPLEATFVEATATEEKITKFGDAILALCEEYGFDGVDMDWEHPRTDGDSKEQYEKLMLYLGEKLHAGGRLLTSAVLGGVTADNLVYYDSAAHTDTVLGTVDWINVMAYDGGDGERHSGYDFAVNCAGYWKDTRGLAKEKVVLGVPFYARPSWAAYSQLLTADAGAWEKDVISYNGMEAWYNGKETIGRKTEYAKENLGGIMIWEITQDSADRDKSLLTAIGEKLR